MPSKQMRGVYPILITPFDEQSRVDEESLRSLVEFNIKSGVHGIGVALGSEVFKLSEAERAVVTKTVVDQVKGRIPVVINTGAAGTDLAVFYSKTAQDQGADAVMVMPPNFNPASQPEVREYFKAISDAISIPIFMQDTSTAHIPGALAKAIAEESANARYIKVESLPTTAMVAETVRLAGGSLTIFGGAGGNYFIEEMRRGSVGTMPFCDQPEAFVKVWDCFQAGDEKGAREAFYKYILPINRIGAQQTGAYYHVHKEILKQRGVIRTTVVRRPAGPPLDEQTARELQAAIDELYGGK